MLWLYFMKKRRMNSIYSKRCKTPVFLAHNMSPGDERKSPWPFRVDYRTGEARGDVSGNMSFILRLFDKLIDLGYDEFKIHGKNYGTGY